MKKYKVAIITRTKNRPLLLRRAINSVLKQTLKDRIMVIVNDGGGKEEVEVLVKQRMNEFKDCIKIIHNKESYGMEAASNIGIKASNSDYIVIHDDDDSWHPEFLEKCVDFLDKNIYPKIGGVITRVIRVFETIEGDKFVTQHTERFHGWLRSMVPVFGMAQQNLFPPHCFPL